MVKRSSRYAFLVTAIFLMAVFSACEDGSSSGSDLMANENVCPDNDNPSVGDVCAGPVVHGKFADSHNMYIYTSSGWVNWSVDVCWPEVETMLLPDGDSETGFVYDYYYTIILDSDKDNPIAVPYICHGNGKSGETPWYTESGDRINVEGFRIEIKSNGEIDSERTFSSNVKKIEPKEKCTDSNEGEYKVVVDTPWVYTDGEPYVREWYYRCESGKWVDAECHAPAEACSESNLGEEVSVTCAPENGNLAQNAVMWNFVCKENGWEFFKPWSESFSHSREEVEAECGKGDERLGNTCIMGDSLGDPMKAETLYVYQYNEKKQDWVQDKCSGSGFVDFKDESKHLKGDVYAACVDGEWRQVTMYPFKCATMGQLGDICVVKEKVDVFVGVCFDAPSKCSGWVDFTSVNKDLCTLDAGSDIDHYAEIVLHDGTVKKLTCNQYECRDCKTARAGRYEVSAYGQVTAVEPVDTTAVEE